jgi:hypothetical protein
MPDQASCTATGHAYPACARELVKVTRLNDRTCRNLAFLSQGSTGCSVSAAAAGPAISGVAASQPAVASLIFLQLSSRSMLFMHAGRVMVRSACCSSRELSACAALPLDRDNNLARAAVVPMLVEVNALRSIAHPASPPKTPPASVRCDWSSTHVGCKIRMCCAASS